MTSNKQPALSIKNLIKVYDDSFEALKGIDLDVGVETLLKTGGELAFSWNRSRQWTDTLFDVSAATSWWIVAAG